MTADNPPIMVRYVDLPRQYRGIKEEVDEAVQRVLSRGDFIMGKEVTELEEKFASFCGTRFALGAANGTDALFLVLKALGIGPGDEVITAPNSFIASAAAIANAGARPVFADVADDFNIDPKKVESVITKKTKAIMPVHLTGRPADMDAIMRLAKKHSLYVIEDAAQAAGARYKERRVGSFGDAGCFSLHPLKTLNAYGDGGMITTNDAALHEKLRKLRNHGLRNRDECDIFAWNSRLDTIQAAIVLIKLACLEEWNARCREIAAYYRKNLKGIVTVPIDRDYEEPIYHTFIIQSEHRDKVQAFLRDSGIETKIHYPIPIHLQKAAGFLGYKKGDFPNAESQGARILSLPIYPELEERELSLVVEAIRSFRA